MPHWGASNEYPKHMFSLRNKKDISILWMKKDPYLLLWFNGTAISISLILSHLQQKERHRETDREKQSIFLRFLWQDAPSFHPICCSAEALAMDTLIPCFIEKYDKSVYLGPVVQSVVSLTSSLRVISLTVLTDSIYNILKFFAEKMWVAFALNFLLKKCE